MSKNGKKIYIVYMKGDCLHPQTKSGAAADNAPQTRKEQCL